MKKFSPHLIFLIFIIAIGSFFRFINLDKPEGMWEDEYISYIEAKDSSLWFKSLHAPLYYIVLHFWMHFFGETDFVIRLLSVVFGILLIYVIYLAGKELDSRKTGLLAAFFVAINSFLIYYSQEVRIYSLLALFGGLAALFLIRILKNPSRLNITGLTIANLGILYTHIIGFVFVFFQGLVFLIYCFLKNRKSLKALWISGIITAVLYIPYAYKAFMMLNYAGPLTGIYCQWWSSFNFSHLLFSFGDVFSPIIINLINIPSSYFDMIFNPTKGMYSLFFITGFVIPSLIGLTGLISAVSRKNIISILLLISSFGFIAVFTIAASMGKVLFITKYLIVIVPVFILVMMYGLVNINNKRVSKALIIILFSINLFVLVGVMAQSAPNYVRNQGNKAVATILNKYNPGEQDIVVMIYGKKAYLKKYYDLEQVKLFDDITKLNFEKYISPEPLVIEDFGNEQNTKIRNFLAADVSHYFEDLIKQNFIDQLEKGGRLMVIINTGVVSADNIFIQNHVFDEDLYEQKPALSLIFSKIAINALSIFEKELKPVSMAKKYAWEVYLFEK